MDHSSKQPVPGPGQPSFETLETLLDTNYAWGYQESREKLRNLYLKATRSQWIQDDVLDWGTDVDIEKPMAPEPLQPLYGSHIYNKMSARERTAMNVQISNWILSQFLHGEQGALLATAQLVDAVPDMDSKLYGATQVMDEARHVDVYNRYLSDYYGFSYPVNPHLKSLLDMILTDSRWDMKCLGMQIMVEGLALAAFGMIRMNTSEPLMRELTTYVMQDEARHVAFGVIALTDFYNDASDKERKEREDFVYEAARLMRDRFLFHEVWEKLGLPTEECKQIAFQATGQVMFRQLLFSKIVPAIKRLGLLSDTMRGRFKELGILQYENWIDPEHERELAEAEHPPHAA